MKQWIIKTKDGTTIKESEGASWDDIDPKNIEEVLFDNNKQMINLPKNMPQYIQAKTASADLGSRNIQIESRYIGFKLGNNIVRIRVDEKTNNISVEID